MYIRLALPLLLLAQPASAQAVPGSQEVMEHFPVVAAYVRGHDACREAMRQQSLYANDPRRLLSARAAARRHCDNLADRHALIMRRYGSNQQVVTLMRSYPLKAVINSSSVNPLAQTRDRP